ncbi:hypothetical protein BYT27DRAFT_7114748, partial [Phlegmacium glaucopus]
GRRCQVPKWKFISKCICGNPVPAEKTENEGHGFWAKPGRNITNCKQAGCETIWSVLVLSAGSLDGFASLARVAGARGKGANKGEKLDMAGLLMCNDLNI